MAEKIELEVSADISGAKNGLKQFSDDLEAFNRRLKDDKAIKLSLDAANIKLRLDEVRKLIKETADEGSKVALTGEMIRLQKELTGAQRALTNYVRTGDEAVSVLGKNFEKINDTVRSGWGAFDFVKEKIAALWPVIAAAFSVDALVSFFNEIEEGRSIIAKTTGETGENLKSLTESARNVFATVPQDLATVSLAVAEINTRFGLTGVALEELTGKLLDFSDVTGWTPAEQIRLVSRLTQDWGLTAEQTAGMLDLLLKASQDTGISVNDLATNLTNYGVQLRTLGFSLGESAALLSKFEKEGVNTEAILAGLNKGLNELAKKSGQTVPQAFEEFIGKVKDAKAEGDALAIAADVLGAKAGPQLALAVREGRFEIEDFTKSLEGSEGQLDRTSEAEGTTSEQLAILTNRVKAAAIPAFEQLGEWIGWAWNKMLDLKDVFVVWIGTLVLATSLGLAKVAETVSNVVSFVGKNAMLIPENFGIAFDNIPSYVQSGLNGMIRKAEEAVNAVSQLLNNIPGVNIGKANFGTLSGDTAAKPLKVAEFAKDFDFTSKLAWATASGIDEFTASFQKLAWTAKKSTASVKWDLSSLFEATKPWAVTSETEEDKKKKAASAKKAADEAEKAAKKAEEEAKKRREELDKADRDSWDRMRKRREEGYKDLTDANKQNIEDVKALALEYGKLSEELEKVGEKGKEEIKKITEEIDALRAKLDEATGQKAADLAERLVAVNKELKETKDSLTVNGGITGEELEARRKSLAALEAEKALIEANTTEAQRREGERLAGRSKAQEIIEAFNAEKIKMEQDIANAEERKKIAEAANAKEISDINAKMELVKFAIAQENAAIIAQDEERRKIEEQFTKFFGKQIEGRKEILQGLIEKTKEARLALASVWISSTLPSETAKASESTKNAYYNITNNSNVDAEALIRWISNEMNR